MYTKIYALLERGGRDEAINSLAIAEFGREIVQDARGKPCITCHTQRSHTHTFVIRQ
jgi:hypothetical protein